MKNQPEPNRIPTGELSRAGVACPIQVPAAALFNEEAALEELLDKASTVSLNAGPGTTQSPEIAPEEFESVYLWFYS